MTNTTLGTFITSTKYEKYFQLWLRIWFEIIEPDVLVIGIFSNAFIFLVMPRTGVTIGQSAKIYYVLIAISDFINLINSWIMYCTINDSMYLFDYNFILFLNNF